MSVEQVEREVAARTYRSLAMKLQIEAGVLGAQAEALDDAAKRIEEGEPVDTLQLPAAEKDERERSDSELWQRRRDRILQAVVRASRKPAHELAEAGLDRIAEEAGEDPQDVDDVKAALDEMIRGGLVATQRVAGLGPRPMVVFVPTREGFEWVGATPPPVRIDEIGYERTVYHAVDQPTQELPAVERDEAVEAGDR